MTIRKAEVRDAGGIASVDVETWQTTYSGIVPQEFLNSRSYEQRTNVWQARISNTSILRPGWFIFVAEDHGGNVIGFAGGGPKQDEERPYAGELGFIYLLKSCQRRDIGRHLVATIALELKQRGHNSMLVWVLAANPCRAFYEALGGHQIAAREVTIGGANLPEVAYGWRDLGELVKMLEPDVI